MLQNIVSYFGWKVKSAWKFRVGISGSGFGLFFVVASLIFFFFVFQSQLNYIHSDFVNREMFILSNHSWGRGKKVTESNFIKTS